MLKVPNKDTLVCTAFRAGGDYTMDHVELLRAQIPDLFVFGVDYPCPPDFHGWWCKMMMFTPALDQDILFFDLDTIITGSIDKYRDLPATHVLRDFYYPEKQIGSGMMYIANRDKAKIWAHWAVHYPKIIAHYRGDQEYLQQFLHNALRWQDRFPDEILSYKKHITKHDRFFEGGHKPHDANVVCFHGMPRPWHAQDQWIKDIYAKCKNQS